MEYFGAKMQRWIPAKVVRRHSDGTYDLDCKQGVAPEKLRTASASPSGSPSSTVTLAPFKEGDRVEYFSLSQSRRQGCASIALVT